MQEFPDGAVSPKPGAKQIGAKILRVTGKILKYKLAVIAVAVVIAYNFVMRPSFLEPIVKKQFEKLTYGKIDLKIRQASLFRGFSFSDVVVHPPPGFKETPILRAREINVLYNVYGFFRGKFGVNEIALKDAEIFIDKKNNIMSVQALMKPSKPKEKEPEKVKKESSPVISWFFDVEIFARIVVENFNFTLDGLDRSNKSPQYAHLKNFTFNFSLLTRDFSRVDTSDPAGLVGLLNALVIELNPQKTIDLAFESPQARLRSKLDFSWLLFYDGLSRKPEFLSRMHIGQDKFPVALGARPAQNLSFLLDHVIEYDAKADSLKIDGFNVKLLGDTILALTGSGSKILKKDRSVHIETGASKLNLSNVYNLAAALTGNRLPAYSGFFSIKPTQVTIAGNTISDQGGISLKNVTARTASLALSIPTLELDHKAVIENGRKPLPVKMADVKLRSNFNGAPLSFDAQLAENQKTDVNFSLRGLNVAPFARGNATGTISTVFTAAGPSPQDLALALRVFSPQLYYFVSRGKSGINRIDFNMRGSVKSSEDFKQNAIHLTTLSFSDKDKEYAPAVDLKSRVSVDKARGIKVDYKLDALTVTFKNLLNSMPVGLQEQFGSFLKAVDIGRTVRADGETSVEIAGAEKAINHTTHIAFPDIKVDDIDITARVRLTPGVTHLDNFSVIGLRKALAIDASGTLKQQYDWVEDAKTGKKVRALVSVPDMRFKVQLAKDDETEILTDTFLVGSFLLAGAAQGNFVDGKIEIKDFSFRNKKARLRKANLLFPFRHDLKLRKSLNLLAGNKERIIKNYNFNRAYNFTIEKIEIPNPNAKGEWLPIIYPRGTYPAVGGSMEYKDNVFVMPVLQMYTLNGLVTISDTLFNLGRLRPSEMEYSTTIQIKDIDLKQLMVKEKADTISDGKLRIDILFTGNRLDKPIANVSGYLSVFYIGPEFAEMVMRAANPKASNFISTVASSAATPKRIDIDVKEGFVYTYIPMNVGILGNTLFAPKEIKNARINIPEFFQRISNEASIYAAPSSDSNG